MTGCSFSSIDVENFCFLTCTADLEAFGSSSSKITSSTRLPVAPFGVGEFVTGDTKLVVTGPAVEVPTALKNKP